MSQSKQQATEALSAIEKVEQRTSVLGGYAIASPHFVLWGLIWLVGYGATDLFPQSSGVVWLIVLIIGWVGGPLLQRGRPALRVAPRDGWRYLLAGLAMMAFMSATFFVMQPSSALAMAAFPPLVIAFLYVLFGLWRGTRWIVAGVATASLTVIGFALLKEHFLLWMAVVGGGTLISTGLWLKRA